VTDFRRLDCASVRAAIVMLNEFTEAALKLRQIASGVSRNLTEASRIHDLVGRQDRSDLL
jgi:hypothetical protein